jgi:predicted transcriptional regulator
MITNGKMSVTFPEDWKKIIRILKDGPASRDEIINRSGIYAKKAISIIRAMAALSMIEIGPGREVRLRDKK